jgi:hypothetical protein
MPTYNLQVGRKKYDIEMISGQSDEICNKYFIILPTFTWIIGVLYGSPLVQDLDFGIKVKG